MGDQPTRIIGIDPGINGGVAALGTIGVIGWCTKMPATDHDLVRLLMETDRVDDLRVHAYVENVHSMPKQGVASTFKFGKNFGTILGVLAALQIPYELVAPSVWQKAMGCLTKGDKNVSKRKAQQLYPSLKITHATADALLIATYGMRKVYR